MATLAIEMDEERKARLEKVIATTQLIGPGDRGRKEEEKRIGFDWDLIGI